VKDRVHRLFDSIFEITPTCYIICEGSVNLVYWEIPIHGWRRPFYQKDKEGWVLSIDYISNAKHHLDQVTATMPPGEAPLRRLVRSLSTNRERILARLSPPFTLLWQDQSQGQQINIQNDGLGFSQLLEYKDSNQWALSNRILAFRALGLDLRIVREEWASKCVLGWMPGQATGFANVSFVGPATHFTVSSRAVAREELKVLHSWVSPHPMEPVEAVESAAASIEAYIDGSRDCWVAGSAGLTGGYDSRAVGAALMSSQNLNFYFRTRGFASSHDVLIARKLTRIANVPHLIREGRALPPDSPEKLRRSMQTALQWQASLTEHHALKTQATDSLRLPRGEVNIMGQHGEIGSGYYIADFLKSESDPNRVESWLYRRLLMPLGETLRPDIRDQVQELIRNAYHSADYFGFKGLRSLQFFYLFERTRRWGSGSQFMQTSKVLAPFLNPDFISAAFSLPPLSCVPHPFHRRAVERFYPAWSQVPYGVHLDSSQRDQLFAECLVGDSENGPFRTAAKSGRGDDPAGTGYSKSGTKLYNNEAYWREIGSELVDDAVSSEGIWSEIFEPSIARERRYELGDHLVCLKIMESLC
jgi:hypothetical protein